MARTVVVLPVLLGIGIAVGLMSCEAPEHAAKSSQAMMWGSGSGGWPDAPLQDGGSGSGSGGWPDAPLQDGGSGSGSGGWPDAPPPDAGGLDAPPMDADVPDAPDDCAYDAPEAPHATAADGGNEPPKDKDGKVIPGWKKKFDLPTPAPGQWWKDTDGVDPAVAGCHYAYTTKCKCEKNDTVVGWIGEECDKDGFLVETNPEAGKCHEHANATGTPDLYDCDLYCKGKGKTKGTCVAVPNVCDGPTGAGTLPSARCECE